MKYHSPMLQRAALVLGGEEQLRLLLRVSGEQLQDWMLDRSPLPMPQFLKVADALSVHAQALRVARIRAARETASYAQQTDMLVVALDAALLATHTELGNVQLKDASGALRIHCQRGFTAPFLDFFAIVSGPESACGAAMAQQQQIVVADVQSHPIFAGAVAGRIMLEAGASAVVSTPIVHASGAVMGMISTHYRRPGARNDSELAMLQVVAGQAASWLEPRSPDLDVAAGFNTASR